MSDRADAELVLFYVVDDQGFALKLAKALEGGGVSAVLEEVLSPGLDVTESVEARTPGGRTVIPVVSPPAVSNSLWRFGIESAVEEKRRVIPVLYRDLGKAEVPRELSGRPPIDFRAARDFEKRVPELLAAIRAEVPDAAAAADPASNASPEAVQTASPRKGDTPAAAQPAQSGTGAQRLLVQREGEPQPQELECTEDLARILARAALFSEHRGERFDLSFTALLLALLASDSAMGRWFADWVGDGGLDRPGLRERGRVQDEAEFAGIAGRPLALPRSNPLLATASAGNLARRAQELRAATARGGAEAPLDVRHLVGAYIYNPKFHEDDLKALKVERRAWSDAFLWQIWKQYFPEVEAWKERHREEFGQEPEVPEGPSTHIATDVWAREDALGYEAYAYALYRFIVHPQTKAPLTISVQAPWGGGKTSLMRMLQAQLDPEPITPPGGAQRRERLRLRQLLKELEKWIDRGAQQVLPRVPGDDASLLYALWRELSGDAGASGHPPDPTGTSIGTALAQVRERLEALRSWAEAATLPLYGVESPADERARLLREWSQAVARVPGKAGPRSPAATVGEAFARVQAACARLDGWVAKDAAAPLTPQPLESPAARRLTVWFNAWKYQETNQVWAGLADAIIRQIADRLPPIERERFWLRLHLRRIDADKVRQAIYDRIFARFWNGFRRWLLGIAGLAAAWLSALFVPGSPRAALLTFGGIALPAATLASAVVEFLRANRDVKDEPASVSLSAVLDLPDYGKELGFVHQVEADLRRVFQSVPPEFFPIVVFIDDLDRCSPSKVAQVMEAVNLFLAGDFDHCVFVLGMDTEMVAAALQAAHKDMIACLPPDAGIPVGWKFMDKFVQLPFLIPPPEGLDLVRYTDALFGASRAPRAAADNGGGPGGNGAGQATPAAAASGTPAATSPSPAPGGRAVPARAASTAAEHAPPAPPPAPAPPAAKLAPELRRRIDAEIEKFADGNAEIRRLISAMGVHFQGNPRELKRFVNLFRLHYFLWAVRRSQELEVPSLNQLVRWTVFSIRWPDVVRWMHRGGQGEWQPRAGTPAAGEGVLVARLKLIEEITAGAADPTEWKTTVQMRLRLADTEVPSWLGDDDLFHFLQRRHDLGESVVLSDGAGKGLW